MNSPVEQSEIGPMIIGTHMKWIWVQLDLWALNIDWLFVKALKGLWLASSWEPRRHNVNYLTSQLSA